MAQKMRPESRENAPDPSNSYERSHPEREAGMGRLDNNESTPTSRPDQIEEAVPNRQESHQVNAEEATDQRKKIRPAEPEHSMNEEELLGWDQAPQDIHNPRQKRHPRQKGKGGAP